MKTVTLTADEAVQKIRQFYNHYSNTDMAECDWFAGRTVDDLNLVNALFDCYIPTLLASRTLSRRSALYQDSKPFLKQDVGFAMDKLNQTDFYNTMNKIVHHDMHLFFLDLAKKKNNDYLVDLGTLSCIIKLLQRQVRKDKVDNDGINNLNMQCKTMNYINYLNSYMVSRGIRIKDLINDKLGINLNVKSHIVGIKKHGGYEALTHNKLLELLKRLQATL